MWCLAACAPASDAPRALAGKIAIGSVLQLGHGGEGIELLHVLYSKRIDGDDDFVVGVEPPDIVFALWAFDRAAFVDPSGEPLADEDFNHLTLRAAQEAPVEGAGECGRCLATPYGEGPLVVHSGSSCPPPTEGVEVTLAEGSTLTDAEVARVRDMIRFEWPGACACEFVPERPSSTQLLEPAETTTVVPHATFAALPSGSIGLFDDQDVTLLSATGTVAARGVPPPGYVAVAVAPSDDAIVVGTLTGRTRAFTLDWYRSDRALTRWIPLPQLTVNDYAPRFVAPVPELAEHFVVAGRRRTFALVNAVQALVCALDPGDCAILVAFPNFDDTEALTHALPLEGGAWAMVSDAATVVLLDRIPSLRDIVAAGARITTTQERQFPRAAVVDGVAGPSTALTRWRVLHNTEITLRDGQQVTVGAFKGAAVAGSRVHMCVNVMVAGEKRGRDVVIGRTYDPAELGRPDLAEGNLGFEVEACRSGDVGVCETVVATGTVVEVHLTEVGARRVLRFDRNGAMDPEAVAARDCQPAAPAPLARLDAGFARHVQVRPRAWMGVRAGGDVALFEDTNKPPRSIYGGQPRPSWAAVVADDDDGAWMFGDLGVIGHLPPRSARVELIAAPELRVVVADAARDHRSDPDEIAFVVTSSAGLLKRLTVDAARRRVTVTDIAAPSEALASVVVEVARGVHVALAARRADEVHAAIRDEVWRIEGDVATNIERSADDPLTAIIETDDRGTSDALSDRCIAYRRISDQGRLANGASGTALRSLSASRGIAWAVGCGGEILKITAAARPGRVERHAFTRDEALQYVLVGDAMARRPYDMTAIGAMCPDHAIAASREVPTNASGGSVHLLELMPQLLPVQKSRADTDVVVRYRGTESTAGALDRGDASAVVVAPAPMAPWLIMGSNDPRHVPGAINQVGATDLTFLASIPDGAAMLTSGRMVVTLQGGIVLISRSTP